MRLELHIRLISIGKRFLLVKEERAIFIDLSYGPFVGRLYGPRP
jgi:hypothetical protein